MPSKVITGEEIVSIIIICFNQGHYLDDAIESALAQKFRQTEVVVVDDGSTDNTKKVAQSYQRISYIYQHNQGISSARNTGLRASTGEFVTFLDADDRLLPIAAEAGLQCFRNHPESGFVFGRYRKVDSYGAVISEANQPPDERDFYTALLQRNLIGMQSTVLYPRGVIERAGGFDERLRSCEDYDLYLRISQKSPVHKHNEVVAEYRKHGHNMSQNYRSMLETTLRVLNAQFSYARQDPRYKEALRSGISNWRNHYGSLMLQDFGNNLRTHGLDRSSIRRIRNIVSTYPRGIRAITKKALRSMIHRSLPTES